MKLRIVFSLFILIFATAAFAQDKPAPTMDLPIYPGSEATMEVSLTNDDILPTLKAILPLLPAKVSAYTQKITPEEIADILKNVTSIQAVQIDVEKSGVSETDVSNFYAKNMPKGQWSRLFWQSTPQNGTIAVYSQGAGEGLYVYRVQSIKVDNKPVKRVMVAKTEGKIDFGKLALLAGKVMP